MSLTLAVLAALLEERGAEVARVTDAWMLATFAIERARIDLGADAPEDEVVTLAALAIERMAERASRELDVDRSDRGSLVSRVLAKTHERLIARTKIGGAR